MSCLLPLYASPVCTSDAPDFSQLKRLTEFLPAHVVSRTSQFPSNCAQAGCWACTLVFLAALLGPQCQQDRGARLVSWGSGGVFCGALLNLQPSL